MASFICNSYTFQHVMDIAIDTNTLFPDLIWGIGFSEIQAGVYCFWVLSRHSPKRILDDNRRIVTHTKLQKQDMMTFVLLQKIIIPFGGFVPALVFNEFVIASQVHRHGFAADRTVRNKL